MLVAFKDKNEAQIKYEGQKSTFNGVIIIRGKNINYLRGWL